MNTFLPYLDFTDSIRCLDNKRLGKQRVEAMQMLNIILEGRTNGGWINHPCTKMWRPYPHALALYMNLCIQEWVDRGFNNTMEFAPFKMDELKMPKWIGDSRLHSSHRSNLLRKDTDWYGQFGWMESDNLPYFWPSKEPGYVEL